MQKQDIVLRFEKTAADKTDQAGHALCRIDGIQENTFLTRRQPDCFKRGRSRNTVAFADITVIDQDLVRSDFGASQMGQRFSASWQERRRSAVLSAGAR